MKRAFFPVFLILACLGSSVLVSQRAHAVGKYCLAWWRERGYNDSAQCSYVTMNVWVWDEQGNPKSDVKIYTTWGVQIGNTGHDGRAEIIIDVNNQYYDLKCADNMGSLSDVAPIMTSQRYPCWGHYSYEMGFLFKSDQNNPGTFDTSLNCTLNMPGSSETDAPYTKSMAFYSTNCADRMSDAFALGNSQPGSSYFGQSFIANGNRVAGVSLQGAIAGGANLTYYCQLLDGGPNGTPIGPVYTFNNVPLMQFWLPFKLTDCPVVSGRTYFLKVWRPEGMNIYQVTNNNYPYGQCYEGSTPRPDRELRGFIVCANYAETPTVHIIAGPTASNVTSNSATITWTTDVVSDSRVDYGSTTSYGQVVTNPSLVVTHSVTLTGLSPSTTYHYKVTSSVTGYNPAVSADFTFTTQAAPRVLRNPGFEDGTTQTAWTKYGTFDSGGSNFIFSGDFFGIQPHSGTYLAGSAASWDKKNGGLYQRVTGFTSGEFWKFTAWVNTYNQGSQPSDTNNRIGLDLTGGTSPTSPSILWSQRASTQYNWQQIGVCGVVGGNALTFFLEAQQLYTVAWNVNAFDDCAIAQVPTRSIAQVLATENGVEVALVEKTVTASTSEIGGSFYVEEPDRSSGIQVATNVSVNRGDRLNIVGRPSINSHGERRLAADIVTKTKSGQTVPDPIFVTDKYLGGEAFGVYTPGVWKGLGPYNVGLLVTCAGRVTARGTDYFYLDDGSAIEDGSGNVGIRVDTAGLANPTQSFVLVTGISTIRTIAGHPVRTLRPRTQADIVGI
ncbi:MAG: fibronectin type III domain-containing protein [Armatimonadota bacterium]